MTASGPLAGVRVLELSGLGPGPYAAMLLSDLSADVLTVDRPPRSRQGSETPAEAAIVRRGRRSIVLDLRQPGAVDLALELVDRADALIDPFRPGVAERLGVGPDTCQARNSRLVYGRMTGWGQDGPLAGHAGHDINFVALAGALHHIGRAEQPPTPPLNLAGDMGGGGLLLAFGMLAALLEARTTGQGQVVDAAIVDGVASLMTIIYQFDAHGWMTSERGTNAFDSGAPYYDVYVCADGRYLSVGAVEHRFYEQLLSALGPNAAELPPRDDRASWPLLKARIAEVIATRTQAQWCETLADQTEICVAPVLTMHEAPEDPHLRARGTFIEVGGVRQPAPAPRFSRTPGRVQRPPASPGYGGSEALVEWLHLDESGLADLRARGLLPGGDDRPHPVPTSDEKGPN